MQVQRRLTTKDLDDAQIGYEKNYDDARAGSLVGFASEGNYPFIGFCPRRQLYSLALLLSAIRDLLVLPLKTV